MSMEGCTPNSDDSRNCAGHPVEGCRACNIVNVIRQGAADLITDVAPLVAPPTDGAPGLVPAGAGACRYLGGKAASEGASATAEWKNLADLADGETVLFDGQKEKFSVPLVGTSEAGLLPAFGPDAPANARPARNPLTGGLEWSGGQIPMLMLKGFNFHEYTASGLYWIGGTAAFSSYQYAPPCVSTGGILYGGMLEVISTPMDGNRTIQRYTVWQQGACQGQVYTCGFHGDVGAWSDWLASSQGGGMLPDYSRGEGYPAPGADNPFVMPYNGYVIVHLAADVNVGSEASLFIKRGGATEAVAHTFWNGDAYTVRNIYTVPAVKGDLLWVTGLAHSFRIIPCAGE